MTKLESPAQLLGSSTPPAVRRRGDFFVCILLVISPSLVALLRNKPGSVPLHRLLAGLRQAPP